MKNRYQVLSSVVLMMIIAVNVQARQTSVKSIGIFTNQVEACNDAKKQAEWWAKYQKTPIEMLTLSTPKYDMSPCNCALKSPSSEEWVCELTVSMRDSAGTTSAPTPTGKRVSDTRNYTGQGGTDVEACVRAKDFGVAFIKSIEGGAISSFSTCDCRRTSLVGNMYSYTCSVDMRYTRPDRSGSNGEDF